MKKIKPKFNLGDKVYFVARKWDYKNTNPCTVCASEGVLFTKMGVSRKCDACGGSGKIRTSKLTYVPSDPVSIIGIHFKDESDFEKGISYDIYDNMYQNYEDTDLFSTKEEALAECERLNFVPDINVGDK